MQYSICSALTGTGADTDTVIATDIDTELCTGGGSDDDAYFYADCERTFRQLLKRKYNVRMYCTRTHTRALKLAGKTEFTVPVRANIKQAATAASNYTCAAII